LLNGESILGYFYDPRSKKVNASWRLLEFYVRRVLGMDENVLSFIKDVSDRIIETIEMEEDNRLKRMVRELERAERLYQFEEFFVRVEKLRQKFRIPKALLTFDEFAMLLTGYGEDINVSWRVVRDLILFRIYERLHDRLMRVHGEEEEEIVGGEEE
jgi:CRISPR-associated protein Cst1